MASIAGIDPLPGLGAYSVSKAGLLGLMRALAKELGPVGSERAGEEGIGRVIDLLRPQGDGVFTV